MRSHHRCPRPARRTTVAVFYGCLCVCVCICCLSRAHVVTGRIPGTMFVYTEPLTHPNNQPLWTFLIPTQCQWSQVELATGEIRYSNTASWSTSRGLSFPHPLSPLCFLYCNSQRDTDLKLTGCSLCRLPLPSWSAEFFFWDFSFCFHPFCTFSQRNVQVKASCRGLKKHPLACKGMHIWISVLLWFWLRRYSLCNSRCASVILHACSCIHW